MISKSFSFNPAPWLPVKDAELLTKARTFKRADMEKLEFENPEFKLTLVHDAQFYFVTDLFHQIRLSDINDKKLTVILPGHENNLYISLTEVLNKYNVSCRNLHVFFLDEYADENGNVAPLYYECGKYNQFMKHFYNRLRPELRPAKDQIHPITTENIAHYSDMIDECGNGGADVMYTSVWWLGRIAGIDPDMPEFAADTMDEYLTKTSCVVTPSPESIAEESMHGIFGCSGDIAAVPPKMATIGPRDVAHARDHVEVQFRGPCGMTASWQRLISRLMFLGPVSQAVPASMLRLFKGRAYVNNTIAQDLVYPEDIPDPSKI